MPSASFVRHWLAGAFVLLGAIIACSSETPPSGPYTSPILCTSDAECSGGKPVCDPLRGCVACQRDAHCEEGHRCVDRSCETLVTCSKEADCEGTRWVACDVERGVCEECLVDGHCGENRRCVEKTCRAATPCTNSRDCPSDTVCDRATNWCVECVTASDCGEESTCVENVCVSRCASDKDCVAQGMLCDVAGGYCVQCIADVDCPESYHCARGACLVDVCGRGEGSCNVSLNAALSCNLQGSGFVPVLCPTGATCAEDGASSACEPWICDPFSTRCSEDGSTLRVCTANGLDADEVDCAAAGGVCRDGACVDVICEPNAAVCDDSNLMRCSEDGTTLSFVTSCLVGEFCDAEEGACQEDLCAHDAAVCVGNVAKTCNADGSGYEDEETDCSATGETCFGGTCFPELCTDGVRHCFDGHPHSCVDAGTRRIRWTTCSVNEYCDDAGAGGAMCRLRTCAAGQQVCDGDVAGICNAEGSGLEPGTTTDCAALDGKACFGGECLDQVCHGTYACFEGNPHQCAANGTAFGTRIMTCQASQHCVENVSSCRADVCAQGLAACDGNVATTCNADGSGYEPGGTPCGAEARCVGGTCLPIICEANAYFCDQGNVYRCGTDGTTSTLSDTCLPQEHCVEGFSTCRADVCTAGVPYCNGELVSTCKEDGSGAVEGGTACPDGQTCDDGACAAVVCAPSERFCEGNAVRLCNDRGTGASTVSTCSVAQFCDDSGATPVCASDICQAEQPTCDGEILAVCEDDGGGYTSHGEDCAATGQVCTRTACAEEDVVLLGDGGTKLEGETYAYLHAYHVTSSRTLTSIEQAIDVSGTSQFTWYVYEHSLPTGTYTRIFEKLTGGSGAGPHGSGPLEVPLVAGRYYVIGVRVIGPHDAYRASGATPTWLSFGQFRTSRETSSTLGATYSLTTTMSGSQYGQRLTTAAP